MAVSGVLVSGLAAAAAATAERHWLEAEYPAAITAPMTIAADKDASLGRMVWVATTFANGMEAAATYRVTVARPGVYVLWGRVKTDVRNGNSFYYAVDEGAVERWDIPVDPAWAWAKVGMRTLTTGVHTLVIRGRESGAGLDKLLVTSDVNENPALAEWVDIGPAWAGSAVKFDLLIEGNKQFVAYYDANGYLTVASRTAGARSWDKAKLQTRVGWDTHNYPILAVDRRGRIHVAANMHNDPLTYFRSRGPTAGSGWDRVLSLVDPRTESSMTYPVFLTGPKGELLYNYRDGAAGRGVSFLDQFDAATGAWGRYTSPLLFGYIDGGKSYPTRMTGGIPIAGDWDHDGSDDFGVYQPAAGSFTLLSHTGDTVRAFRFGPTGSDVRPVAGDWNGDGTATIGVYDSVSGIFYLTDDLAGRGAAVSLQAAAGGVPLSGDWNGDGKDGVGLYTRGDRRFQLWDSASAAAREPFRFARNDITKLLQPVAGHWGKRQGEAVGLYDASPGGDRAFYRQVNDRWDQPSYIFSFLFPGRQVIAGDWDGDGVATPGLYDEVSGAFYLTNQIEPPVTMNAYPALPRQGGDGVYHMAWIWKNAGGPAMCHDLSYARSPDLKTWYSASGEQLQLPLVTGAAVVDPIPVKHGLLNGIALALDGNRPIITYHKLDSAGHNQIYNAWFDGTVWRFNQMTHWDLTWTPTSSDNLGLTGGIAVFPPERDPVSGSLTQDFHAFEGRGGRRVNWSGTWKLNSDYSVAAELPRRREVPRELKIVETACSECNAQGKRLGVRIVFARAARAEDAAAARSYFLRWESLGHLSDKQHGFSVPGTVLRLYQKAVNPFGQPAENVDR